MIIIVTTTTTTTTFVPTWFNGVDMVFGWFDDAGIFGHTEGIWKEQMDYVHKETIL